jgi:hypothetical protein
MKYCLKISRQIKIMFEKFAVQALLLIILLIIISRSHITNTFKKKLPLNDNLSRFNN